MPKSDLTIDVLGTAVSISADEESDYLRTLLAKYRRTIENVKSISGLGDPLKIAVLTGFLLCDDLEKAGSKAPEKSAPAAEESFLEAERLTLGMISRLDETLRAEKEKKTAVFPAEPAAAADRDTSPSGGGAETARNRCPPLFKLRNTVKNYGWGSPEWLPAFLGQKNLSRVPWAELWMGVNPGGPSRVETPSPAGKTGADGGQDGILLSELIGQDTRAFLGGEVREKYGKLPFLFKVEAAAKPLSIQAHPNSRQAKEGFERENLRGIPLDAAERNYRDSNHKPEIICALTPFIVLSGFKKPETIRRCLESVYKRALGEFNRGPENGGFEHGLETLISALKREDENPLKAFLSALFGLESGARELLKKFITTRALQLKRDFPAYGDEWDLCVYLSDKSALPGDPGALAPLYLNLIELKPGEAMFLPAGVFHAYIYGMGIELMADSDNVLRGGLSAKRIDTEELLKVLCFEEYSPEILKVPAPAPAWYSYPSSAEEFTLSAMNPRGGAFSYTEAGPSIVLVTGGNAVITEKTPEGDEKAAAVLSKGESAFIVPGRNLVFSGNFTAYAAAAGRSAGNTG